MFEHVDVKLSILGNEEEGLLDDSDCDSVGNSEDTIIVCIVDILCWVVIVWHVDVTLSVLGNEEEGIMIPYCVILKIR